MPLLARLVSLLAAQHRRHLGWCRTLSSASSAVMHLHTMSVMDPCRAGDRPAQRTKILQRIKNPAGVLPPQTGIQGGSPPRQIGGVWGAAPPGFFFCFEMYLGSLGSVLALGGVVLVM